MARITAKNAAEQDFVPLMEALSRAHQAFALYDGELHRLSGADLTAPQAKVIFCLGNTDGLTCSEITEQTLITKGTLTGVIDRLEDKGLVQRWGDSDDGRRIIVDLTKQGERLFASEYPRYIAALKERFDVLSARDRNQAVRLLEQITSLF